MRYIYRGIITGPGTKLNKRLNPDLTPKEWSKPINRVDKASYNHDICYLKNDDTATRNAVCDKNMLKELKEFIILLSGKKWNVVSFPL